MRKILFLFFALQYGILASAFYPISPRPLRLLVAESQLIIRGKVVEIGYDKQREKDRLFDADFALIRVVEVWQGELKEKEVKVYFCKGMICPLPGVFFDGEEVLAFLDKESKGSDYEVHALSYGVKHDLNEAGFRIYKDRIREMQEIRQMTDGKEKSDRIREWLVTCAEQRETRWDGVYELKNIPNRFKIFSSTSSPDQELIVPDSSQRKRLFIALMGVPVLDHLEMDLVDMVRGIDDCSLQSKLQTGFLGIDTGYEWHHYLAASMMEKIVSLSNHAGLREICQQYNRICNNAEDDSLSRRVLFSSFCKEMQTVFCQPKKEDCDKLIPDQTKNLL